ncbi:uncharacterized protein PHALS_15409 [Plasmopara halstedii]|uniref:Uncharacterized protein n=1 Tax=Plasmopara halstedii TaxID=4781 RepID=A0A0P1AFK5_PLAHL|nr:uncharacterized protein PHALS_15409 [Plasmopara halstedii]CEG39876.1 hypothetical protein PHALS_15409 [Plasmopara halstedii]|eukprot:XP_024576245.1 hypothetical protein PHALS_15409 [Plasmopara halstedii]
MYNYNHLLHCRICSHRNVMLHRHFTNERRPADSDKTCVLTFHLSHVPRHWSQQSDSIRVAIIKCLRHVSIARDHNIIRR